MKNPEESLHSAAGLEYRLCRARVKSLSIRILEGSVVVKASFDAPLAAINAFVTQKQAWISAKLEAYRVKIRRFSAVLEYRAVLMHGVSYPVVISATVKKAVFADEKLLIPRAAAETEEKLCRTLRAWYSRHASGYLEDRIIQLSEVFGLPFGGFSLTGARTKWGSCDAQNRIRLNFRLSFLPPNIRDYVIIHELCHTKYHNHGPLFWEHVEKNCPVYRTARKELKEYSVLAGLYR